MIRTRMFSYLLACVAVGIGWDVVLRIDPTTWWILGSLSNESGWMGLLCFVITSLGIGLAFRRFISSGGELRSALAGCVLTFAGAVLHVWLTLSLSELVSSHPSHLSLAQVLEVYAVAPLIGLYFAASHAYLTLPLGILSVFALRGVVRIDPSDVARALGFNRPQ